MSLAARLLNVFAVPGEVFTEVSTTRLTAGNWVVPMLLSAVIGAVSVFIIFSQPAIQQKIHEQQEKMFQKQVDAGQMKQADADKIAEAMSNPMLLKIAGSGGAVMVSVTRLFWWALVLWLLGRWFLKVQVRYPKALEVAGLAMMIGVLEGIVVLLLTVNLGRMFATPSLALAITDFDATRKSHLFLGAANVFAFWQIGVTSVGLAKLAGVPFLRAAVLVFAYWCLQESFFIMVGLGQLAL